MSEICVVALVLQIDGVQSPEVLSNRYSLSNVRCYPIAPATSVQRHMLLLYLIGNHGD